jgi:hypothetical protein
MADELNRRLVGAIHAELEKQQADNAGLFVSEQVDSAGILYIDGDLDLYLLAQAVRGYFREEEP